MSFDMETENHLKEYIKSIIREVLAELIIPPEKKEVEEENKISERGTVRDPEHDRRLKRNRA